MIIFVIYAAQIVLSKHRNERNNAKVSRIRQNIWKTRKSSEQ